MIQRAFHIPIFIINLKRSKDRLLRMLMQMKHFNLSFTVVEAIDGSLVTESEKKIIQKNRNILLYKKPFTDGEIGCALSHMMVYKKIIDEKIKEVLIMEDDVILYESLRTVVQRSVVKRMPQNWDIVLCGYVQHGNIYSNPYKNAHVLFWNRKKIGKRLFVGVPVEFCYHTAGYMISYEGAKKLYEYGMPIRMPADILIGNAHSFGVSTYVLRSPCVRQYIWHAPESTVKDKKEMLSSKERFITAIFSSQKKWAYIFLHVMKVYFLFKNIVINTAKGYGFPIRFLRKLGIISLDRKEE